MSTGTRGEIGRGGQFQGECYGPNNCKYAGQENLKHEKVLFKQVK